MEILKARMDDLNDIYELVCILEHTKLDWDAFSRIYKEQHTDVRFHPIIVKEGERIIGFMNLQVQPLLHHAGTVAEIQELVVREELRSGGIGAALFKKALEIAEENDCILIEVCSNRLRERAHGFYERQGMAKSHFKFTLPDTAQ